MSFAEAGLLRLALLQDNPDSACRGDTDGANDCGLGLHRFDKAPADERDQRHDHGIAKGHLKTGRHDGEARRRNGGSTRPSGRTRLRVS